MKFSWNGKWKTVSNHLKVFGLPRDEDLKDMFRANLFPFAKLWLQLLSMYSSGLAKHSP